MLLKHKGEFSKLNKEKLAFAQGSRPQENKIRSRKLGTTILNYKSNIFIN
jgi:hypothetical protein